MASPAGTSSRDALAARVEAAAAALPADARTALALRERDGAGYAEVAAALGIAPAEVGERLLGARLAVREAVRGEGEPPHLTNDCGRVRALLCRRQDGERLDDAEAALVTGHVADCSACRATRRALTEASLVCRAWTAREQDAARPLASPAHPIPASDARPTGRSVTRPPARRRRRAAAVMACAVLAGAAAAAAIGAGGGPSTDAQDAQPASASPAAPAAEGSAAAAERRREAAQRRREATQRRRRLATQRRRAAAAARAATATATPAAAAAPTTAPAAPAAPTAQQRPARTPTPAETPRATATPAPASTPAATPKPDIVPGGGDTFCPPDEQDC